MDWSGTTPTPDGEHIPHTLTGEEIRRRQDPASSNWIIWVGAALVVGIPLLATFFAALQ